VIPLNVLAVQLVMVQQQLATLTEHIRQHHDLCHGAEAIKLDVARMQLTDAAERVTIAAELVRRVSVARCVGAPVATMTPAEVMRQVEARA
jgi:hypothetical protein